MLMLTEGVKSSESGLESPLDFRQAFIEGFVSSGKKLKILLGEEILRAEGSPLGPRFLDYSQIGCRWEFWQGKVSFPLLSPPERSSVPKSSSNK